VCLRLVTGNPNLKILAYRFENWPHIRIAEVHLEPMAALLADVKSQFACDCTQGMITGKRMSANRVKRSQNIQLTAGHRSSVAKCEYFSLHGENTSV